MGKWLRGLAVFLLGTLFPPLPAAADYQFDDLYKPSGGGAQWMAVTGEMNTGGNPTSTELQVLGNFVLGRYAVRVENGNGLGSFGPNGEGRDIHTLFLVLPGSTADMTVRFRVSPEIQPEVVTPVVDAALDDYDQRITPIPASTPDDRKSQLTFTKKPSAGSFGTSRGVFIFHE
ncbi:MAG: hypothetical protein LBL51_02105, partial [Synergistaceae bacterium]|nr:hypothetical protein [Synergistaceae bacterium]